MFPPEGIWIKEGCNYDFVLMLALKLDSVVDAAIAFINENLDRNLRLTDLATVVEMSPYHFARRFKQLTSLTPYQYLVRQRLFKAQELLRNPNLVIADIAYLVGYKNPSHFAKVFRRHLKISPTAYRNVVK